jgi:hypothetical protein
MLEIVKELAAGGRFERPYPDSKSRVLPLDDPASSSQRYRLHAPDAQHRRVVEVVAQSFAIDASAIHKLTVIPAPIAIKFGSDLDFKSIEFNRFGIHNLVAARRLELPSQP